MMLMMMVRVVMMMMMLNIMMMMMMPILAASSLHDYVDIHYAYTLVWVCIVVDRPIYTGTCTTNTFTVITLLTLTVLVEAMTTSITTIRINVNHDHSDGEDDGITPVQDVPTYIHTSIHTYILFFPHGKEVLAMRPPYTASLMCGSSIES